MNILLTSVGRRSYLVHYFKEELKGRGRVFVSNSSELSPAFRVADGHTVTPLIYDEDYIPYLIDYCQNNCINAIISLFDIDLPILAMNKQRFRDNNIEVIVSDSRVIDICNDKWKTYLFLKENGFYVPETFLDIDVALNEIEAHRLNFPLFVKPRWGMGSISVFKAENQEELIVFYHKISREVHHSYLKYESAIDKEHCVLIQQMLTGQEYGIDVINDLNGTYQNTIVKQKIAMRAGETDCAKTVYNETISTLGESISKKLRHVGNLDADVFLVGNKPYVLEMNARFGGGYPFSHMAGVNLPQAIVQWLANEPADRSLFNYRENKVFQKDIQIVEL
ncbi:MAG: ATP-grasp domain-containing protein [Clostridia bacterium]|nr:ATP-grasp domain-containing protein [Clostridia bacterium]